MPLRGGPFSRGGDLTDRDAQTHDQEAASCPVWTFGQSSERSALLDQLQLQSAELEENTAKIETAADSSREDCGFIVRAPQAGTLAVAEALPWERIVDPVPANCPCCGESRLRKIGDLVPRQRNVIQHLHEKLVCRACDAIFRPSAPECAPVRRAQAAGPCLLGPSTSCTCRFIARSMSIGL